MEVVVDSDEQCSGQKKKNKGVSFDATVICQPLRELQIFEGRAQFEALNSKKVAESESFLENLHAV